RERRPLREPARRPPREREREPLRGDAVLSPEAQAALRRRRLAGGLIAALVVAGVVLGIVLLTGGSDNKKTARTAPASAQTRILGELLLRPVGTGSRNNQGIAIVAQRGGERDLIVQA